jgi:stringent starvation protein B
MSMSSSRPYLIRALYDWIVDNRCTPYVLVDAAVPGVEVPQQHVKNGQIVLNIAPQAVSSLVVGNEELRFRGRFSGVAMDIVVPVGAVRGIYARENGQGMVFEAEEPPTPPPENAPEGGERPSKRSLRVVK